MTVLVTADLHFSDNPRDQYRHDFQPRLREIVQREHVSTVVILGDLTEAKEGHNARLVNRVVEHMHALSIICRQIIIVRGNHDYTEPDNPFFRFLRFMPNTTWINQPTEADELRGEIGRTMLLPNTSDPERDWKGIDFQPFDWVLTHNTFRAAQAAPGIRLTGIDPEAWFPPTVEVISGDIHVPHTIGHVTYVGAPYSVDFGDRYRPRVLLLTGQQARSLRVGGAQKRLVRLDGLKHLASAASEVAKGDVVQVEITLSPDQHAEWADMQRTVREWGAEQGVTIHLVKPVVQQPEASAAPRAERRHQTDEELMVAYGTARGVDERTMQTGRWLMEQA